MHFRAVLNREGGALRTMDLAAFEATIRGILESANHSVETAVVSGKDINGALERAARDQGVDVVLVGGGDGTVSSAAAALMNSDKALAILPAGTMNLFARGLGIPLQLEAALEAFAQGVVRTVDVASANGKPFVHQFSIGMHADLIEKREALDYSSRLGKIAASFRAAFETIWNPPRVRVRLELDRAEIVATTSNIGVSNNVFDEGHLPFAEMPNRGELGIYITRARRRSDVFSFVLHLLVGRWRSNPQIEIHRSDRVTLTLLSSASRFLCAVDGELQTLEERTEIRCHPGALKVLVPAQAAESTLARVG
jgi:diacylglycerol kinase family enzyme